MAIAGARWVFLVGAVFGAARCALFKATPGRVAFAAACGLVWYWLSRRKVLSLDRGTLGIPPRGR